MRAIALALFMFMTISSAHAGEVGLQQARGIGGGLVVKLRDVVDESNLPNFQQSDQDFLL